MTVSSPQHSVQPVVATTHALVSTLSLKPSTWPDVLAAESSLGKASRQSRSSRCPAPPMTIHEPGLPLPQRSWSGTASPSAYGSIPRGYLHLPPSLHSSAAAARASLETRFRTSGHPGDGSRDVHRRSVIQHNPPARTDSNESLAEAATSCVGAQFAGPPANNRTAALPTSLPPPTRSISSGGTPTSLAFA